MNEHPNNPLHGMTLEKILWALVDRHGWEAMGKALDIRCFTHNPSIKSSLVFLRRTPWARERVEKMFLTGIAGTSGLASMPVGSPQPSAIAVGEVGALACTRGDL